MESSYYNITKAVTGCHQATAAATPSVPRTRNYIRRTCARHDDDSTCRRITKCRSRGRAHRGRRRRRRRLYRV